MKRLDKLEATSVHILREAYRRIQGPVHALVCRQGQQSVLLLWLARKVLFSANVPFPLEHIDTGFKIPEMIAYLGQAGAGI